MKILAFFDAHDTPETHQERFHLLGSLIVDKRPDVIVQGGDFLSLESLSHWDRDKRKLMEGRRYQADIHSANVAIDIMTIPLWSLQGQQRKNKEKLYRPDLVWMEGNHEAWLDQYICMHPELEGAVDLKSDLSIPYELFRNVKWVPWIGDSAADSTVFIGGVGFTHVPRSRTGAISSKYLCTRTLAETYDCSIVFGHTHRFQVDTVNRVGRNGDSTYMALNAGGFFQAVPEYAKGNNNDYWQGCVMIETNGGSLFDYETFSLTKLYRMYT